MAIGKDERLLFLGEDKDKFEASPHTVRNWIRTGIRRPGDGQVITLESKRVGGKLATSEEALERFFAALNPEDSPALHHVSLEDLATELHRRSTSLVLVCDTDEFGDRFLAAVKGNPIVSAGRTRFVFGMIPSSESVDFFELINPP